MAGNWTEKRKTKNLCKDWTTDYIEWLCEENGEPLVKMVYYNGETYVLRHIDSDISVERAQEIVQAAIQDGTIVLPES